MLQKQSFYHLIALLLECNSIAFIFNLSVPCFFICSANGFQIIVVRGERGIKKQVCNKQVLFVFLTCADSN